MLPALAWLLRGGRQRNMYIICCCMIYFVLLPLKFSSNGEEGMQWRSISNLRESKLIFHLFVTHCSQPQLIMADCTTNRQTLRVLVQVTSSKLRKYVTYFSLVYASFAHEHKIHVKQTIPAKNIHSFIDSLILTLAWWPKVAKWQSRQPRTS